MAILNKPDIQVLIDDYTTKVNTVIVANGVGAITGPILNDVLQDSIEILTDIKDSYYNLLSETRTALSTTYNPAIPASYSPLVTETKAALDQQIQRIVDLEGNPSQNIAFVSTTGIDIEAEVGNDLKPFATFGAAISAVPVNSIVKFLGGNYNTTIETLGYIFINKNGITLDISGTTINGRIFFRGSDITLISTGSLITDTGTGVMLGIGSGSTISNLKIIGGTFISTNGSCFSFSQTLTTITIKDAIFQGNRNLLPIGDFAQTFANIVNCSFTNQLGIAIRCTGAKNTFVNCKFLSQNEAALQLLSNTPTQVSVKQCELRGRIGLGGTNTTGFYFDAIIEDSYLEGSDYGVFYGAIADNVRFTNNIISGGIDSVSFATIERTTANNNNIFEKCSLYAVTGNIFAGTFAVGDLGNAYATNCIYNKAFVSIPELIENGITVLTGIQNVEF